MLPAEPHGKAFMTKKAKARGGIVGSGFAANLHYEGIRRVYGTDVELVGLFSPTAANARRFAEPRGLRTFDSLEALLAEVDVVHVCASPAAHEAVTVAALRRGVHAVVEKPLTGWFGDGAAGLSRLWRVDAGGARRRAGQHRSHARRRGKVQGDDPLRRELGVCAGHPEGARDHREDRRAGAVDAWRGGPLRLAQQGLRLLAPQWRRRADRQGRPSA